MSESKSAVIFLAEGAEDMEFIITVDVLRLAEVDVTVVGVPDSSPKKCGRGVVMSPEKSISDVMNGKYDALIIPRGLEGVQNLIKQGNDNNYDTLPCPLVMKEHGIGLKKTIKSHPFVKKDLISDFKFNDDGTTVTVDGELITSRAPGTTMDFALSITEKLVEKQTREQLSRDLLHSR